MPQAYHEAYQGHFELCLRFFASRNTTPPNGLNSVYTWIGIPIYSTDDLGKPLARIAVDDIRHVYPDYNATTPLRPEIVECLVDHFEAPFEFGDPSSSTNLGESAYDRVHQARSEIADCLKVKPKEIVFTSSGSEANNLAIKSLAFQHLEKKGHILSSKMEHPSILRTLEFLQQRGFDVTYLEMDADGRVSPQAVKDHLQQNTILVSIMAANNEIGMINPMAEIGQLCQPARVPFMVDAVQAFGKIPLKPKDLKQS